MAAMSHFQYDQHNVFNPVSLNNCHVIRQNNLKSSPYAAYLKSVVDTVFPRMLTADTISFRRREAANTK